MGNKLSCIRPDFAEFPRRGSSGLGLRPKFSATISEGEENTRRIYSEEERKELIRRLKENDKRYELESKTESYGFPDGIWEEALPPWSDPEYLWRLWEVHPRFRLLSEESLTKEVFISLKHMEKLNELHRAFCEGPIETRSERIFTPSLCLQLDVANEKVEQVLRGNYSIRSSFAEFQNKVTSLLEVFGEQIWYFRFVLDSFLITSSIGVSENQVYIDLFRWVSLMPNLKGIVLDFRGLLPREEAGALSYPLFPHLPQLERIEIGHFSDETLRKRLMWSVISPNLHIKYLKLDGLNERSEADMLFLMEMEPLLSMLNLSGFE